MRVDVVLILILDKLFVLVYICYLTLSSFLTGLLIRKVIG